MRLPLDYSLRMKSLDVGCRESLPAEYDGAGWDECESLKNVHVHEEAAQA